MKERVLNCAMCGKHYHTYSTASEMTKEMLEITPEAKNDKTVEICDPCFKIYKIWIDSMTPEERLRMHKE